MKLLLSTLVIMFFAGSSMAQYNPLWIKHCRNIPTTPESYKGFATTLESKVAMSPDDDELNFLLAVSYLGIDEKDRAKKIFDELAGAAGTKASIKVEAENYKKFMETNNPGQVKIAIKYLNLKKAPDDDAPLKGRVYQDAEFSVIEEQGDWLYIVNVGNQGWVSRGDDLNPNVKGI
ncbi:MAG: SH3 domain-containing protein [Cyclobacteriaceae bacterium]